MKLTPSQREVLKGVVDAPDGRPYTCAEIYKPALKLVTFGLVIGRPYGFGRLELTPTDAGKALRATLP